jgi:PIN domain nuclease of toxin-antitoxin system
MDFLLDTHVLIWLDLEPHRVGKTARALIDDPSNRVYVSAASAWEISAKRRKGALPSHLSGASFVANYSVSELPVTIADGDLAGLLNLDHADPFDRMILAQAQRRGMTVVTSDRVMRSYEGVAIVSAD